MRTICKRLLAGGACAVVALASAGARAEEPQRNEPRPTSQLLWLGAEGGVESVHLTTFSADFDRIVVGLTPTAAFGPAMGVGAGVRFVFLTLGARARFATFENDPSAPTKSWQLYTVDAELGFRIPLRRFEPHLTFAAGYVSLDGIGDAARGFGRGLDVSGANGRAGFGVDYFVSRHVSLGIDLTGEILALSRNGVSLGDLARAKQIGTIDDAKARVLEASGSSVGSALTLTGGLTLHF
jgi:hypothetical protein